MKCLRERKVRADGSLSFVVWPTSELRPTVNEAYRISRRNKCTVRINFNGIRLTVKPSSDVGAVVDTYHRAR